MGDWLNLDTLIEVMLGISLGAAAGFRVSVPLLVLSAAAVWGHFDLPSNLDWIENSQALIVFTLACILEVGGYAVPWLDHLLDIVATPAAILAGTVVAASTAPEMNPIVQWTLALVVGGGTAGITKGLMNILRLTSTGASGGLTNPILSTIELVVAIALSVLAVTVPALAALLVFGVLTFAFIKIWQFFSKRPSPPPPTDSVIQ